MVCVDGDGFFVRTIKAGGVLVDDLACYSVTQAKLGGKVSHQSAQARKIACLVESDDP